MYRSFYVKNSNTTGSERYIVHPNIEPRFYGGRRLYIYYEDNCFIQVLIVNKLFSNYKFTCN